MSVTVTCDVPPVAVNDTATVAEDDVPTAVTVLANDTDPDGGLKTIASATQPDHGLVALTGGTPGAHTGLTYRPDPHYCNSPPGTTPDTFTYALAPGGSSATVSVTVTCVDDTPTAVNDSVTVLEDATAGVVSVLANDTDIDGGPKTISSATQPTNGTVVLAGPVGAHTGLTYKPNAGYCNSEGGSPDTFTYTLNGGSTATVSITVTCTPNAAPVIAAIEGGALAYTEDAAATPITASTTVTDADSTDFATGTLTVDYSAGGLADDRLEIRNQGTTAGLIGVSGANVTYGGTTIGTFTGGTGTTPLEVTLNASATPTATQALVRNITYDNVSDNPATNRTVRFVLTDGDGGTSAPATRQITVTGTNDAPVLSGIETSPLAYPENGIGLPSVSDTLVVADADDANIESAVVKITAGFVAGDDLLFSGTIPGDYDETSGELTLTGSSPKSAWQQVLRSIRFRNLTSDNPGTSRTISFTVNDGSANSNTVTRAIAITEQNDPPAVTTTPGTVNANQQVPTVIDGGITVTDPDSLISRGDRVHLRGVPARGRAHPARPTVAGRHHRLPDRPGPDAHRHDHGRQLPGRPAIGHLHQHQQLAERRPAHGPVPGQGRRHPGTQQRYRHTHDPAGRRPRQRRAHRQRRVVRDDRQHLALRRPARPRLSRAGAHLEHQPARQRHRPRRARRQPSRPRTSRRRGPRLR